MILHIVLVHPEIPPNTGNIARLCAATNTFLHLVKPLGFSLSDRYLKRAGLDYWPHVKLLVHNNWEDLLSELTDSRFWFFSARRGTTYTEVEFKNKDVLVFGSETKGLPTKMLEEAFERKNLLRIPISDNVRSLNLSNAAAVVLFEARRQLKIEIK